MSSDIPCAAALVLAATAILCGCEGPSAVRPVQGIRCATEQEAAPARQLAIHFLTNEGYDDFRRKWRLSSDTVGVAVVSDSTICQRVARAVYAGRQDSMRRPPAPLAVVDLQKVYLTQEVGCALRTVEVDHQFRWVGIWDSPDTDC